MGRGLKLGRLVASLVAIAIVGVQSRAPTPRAKWKMPPVAKGVRRSGRPAKVATSAPAVQSVALTLAGAPPITVSVFEVVDRGWWELESARKDSNPYGAKCWPGALAVAQFLAQLQAERLAGVNVLELGCGNGLCSLVAASRGCTATATDISRVALGLVNKAAKQQNLRVQPQTFDLSAATPLPPADLVIASDMLYDPGLAVLVADRVAEAAARGSWVLVGSHKLGGYDAFTERLAMRLRQGSGSVNLPPIPMTTVASAVACKPLKWKEKRTRLLHVNSPKWVPAKLLVEST